MWGREIRSKFLPSKVFASSWDFQISVFFLLNQLHFSVAEKKKKGNFKDGTDLITLCCGRQTAVNFFFCYFCCCCYSPEISTICLFSVLHTESQKYWLEWIFGGHLVQFPTYSMTAANVNHVSCGFLQLSSENLHGWRFHPFSGQPVPMLRILPVKNFFLMTSTNLTTYNSRSFSEKFDTIIFLQHPCN